MIHRVHQLPLGGEYTRTRCGLVTNDPAWLVVSGERPEQGCRKCWRNDEPTDRTKLKQIALIVDGPEFTPETVKAILEGRYYATDRSPKAA